jgi:hypothetical protein
LQFKVSLGKQFRRPYLKNTQDKKRAGGMVQGVEFEFKLQDCEKKKKKKDSLAGKFVSYRILNYFMYILGLNK